MYNLLIPQKKSLGWLLFLVLLLIFEFYLFSNYISRDIINFYPSNIDQASYLSVIYKVYDKSIHSGLLSISWNEKVSPNSIIFTSQTVLAFLLFNASRYCALLINFIFFALAQVILANSIKSYTKSYIFGLIGIGLFLMAKTPFQSAGGIADYRIDFAACCFYGILICSIIKSAIFFDRLWSIISGFLGVYLILLRCITAVYIFPIALLFGIYLLYQHHKITNCFFKNNLRLMNLSIFVVIVALFFVPCVYYNYQLFYDYYVVGHVTGIEKSIRVLQAGVSSLSDEIFYYPRKFLHYHLGNLAFYLLIIVVGLLSWQYKKITASKLIQYDNYLITFLTLAILVPVIILSLDKAKSPIVVNIILIPFLWLSVYFLYKLFEEVNLHFNITNNLLFFAGACLLAGIINQLYYYKTSSASIQRLKDLTILSNMYDDIGNYFQTKKVSRISLATDKIVDYINYANLQILYYEKHKKLLNTESTLGRSIFTITFKEAQTQLAVSNLVIIDSKNNSVTESVYPFDQAMDRIRPKLTPIIEKNFKLLNNYKYDEHLLKVYVR